MVEDSVIRLDDDFNDLSSGIDEEVIAPPPPLKPQEKIKQKILALKERVRSDKRLRYGAMGAVGLLVLLLLGLLILALRSDKESSPSLPPEVSNERILKEVELQKQPVDISRLETMIKKANLLYAKGEKGEALHLYESISSFSESLSSFNLGVAQAEENNYQAAIASFQRAIDSGEDRAMSAINAAMCAYWLQNSSLYHYYVNLAEAYLPEAANLPLYPYLYALVSYYKGYYFEVLSPLTHFQKGHYEREVDHLLAKMHLYYGDSHTALRYLERSAGSKDYLDLAHLSARVGDYQAAQNYLLRHIESGDDTPTPYMAMALIDAKLGRLGDVASVLNKYTGEMEREIASIYPIKVRLQESLFDVHEAQRHFWSDFSSRQVNAYKILFYYAPYKVFDANQALLFIRQGGLNILLNDIEEAKDVLVKGSTISKVNLNIAKALRESLQNNTREANRLMKMVVNEYPNHAILHYNLGLSYAQMGDFDNAYRHFLRAHHLNSRDILAGIFTMMSAKLTFRDYARVADTIAHELEGSELEEEERHFLLALLGYFQGGEGIAEEWLEGLENPKSIYLALGVVGAVQSGNKERMMKMTGLLQSHLPEDLVSALLALLAENYGDDPKNMALKAQGFYKENRASLQALYYGPALARELYVRVGYNIGALPRVQQRLDEKLISERGEARGIVQALALTSLYLREFEKAFVLYNSLIDDMKERDTQTLFLAAVAAIGAGHHENAVALLQLAKLEAPTNYESRYALGLLQQEAKNLKAAAIQFAAVGNVGFQSEFFDFEIDTSAYLP